MRISFAGLRKAKLLDPSCLSENISSLADSTSSAFGHLRCRAEFAVRPIGLYLPRTAFIGSNTACDRDSRLVLVARRAAKGVDTTAGSAVLTDPGNPAQLARGLSIAFGHASLQITPAE